MAKKVIVRGDRVKLTWLANPRHLGYGLRRGMVGTVQSVGRTTYAFLGEYKPRITIPQKRYQVRLDTPTKAMVKRKIGILGFWGDEIRLVAKA